MNRRRTWTFVVLSFVFAEAIATQARGPVLASLEATYGVSESALGLVALTGTLGFLFAVLATGLRAGRIRLRRTLVVSIAGVGIALVLMAVAPVYGAFLLALFVQGAASGAFRGIDRVVLSHLHPHRRGRIYTTYALVWAVGAVLGPQLVSGVLLVADWRVVFLIVAVLFVPAGVVASRAELPSMDAERSLSWVDLRRLLGNPAVAGACVGMVLVGALEGVLFTWLVYYATGYYGTATANLVLSVYLLAYVPARLVYRHAAERVPYLALLFAAMLPVVPALAIAFSGVTGLPFFLGVFVAGIGISGGYPTLSAYAVEGAPEYSGPLNALTHGSTYVGMSIAPATVGVLAELYGIGRAMWVTVGIAGVLLVATAATWLLAGTVDAPTSTAVGDEGR